MILFRFVLAGFAVILIFVGAIVTIAPTPFGFILVILGFLLLASAAPGVVRWLRGRWRWLDRRLDKLEERAPRWLAKIFQRTDPGDNEEEEASKQNSM